MANVEGRLEEDFWKILTLVNNQNFAIEILQIMILHEQPLPLVNQCLETGKELCQMSNKDFPFESMLEEAKTGDINALTELRDNISRGRQIRKELGVELIELAKLAKMKNELKNMGSNGNSY